MTKRVIILLILLSALFIATEDSAAETHDGASLFKLLKTVHFDYKCTLIDSSRHPALDSIAALFLRDSTVRFDLHGHADTVGGGRYNMRISTGRTHAVRDYLISRGVSPENITTFNFGDTRPAAENHTDEGRAMNRRVQVFSTGRLRRHTAEEPLPVVREGTLEDSVAVIQELLDGDPVITVLMDDSLITVFLDDDDLTPPPRAKGVRRGHRVGLRIAVDLSSASGMGVREHYFDFGEMLMAHRDYGSRDGYVGSVPGFEVQIPAFFGLTHRLALYASPGIAYRVPFNAEDDAASVSEYAVTLPLMLDARLRDRLHIAAGVQADITAGAKIRRKDGETFDFGDRAKFDAGVVAALSVYITESFFVDTRGIYGLTDFAGENTGSLHQFSIGLGWLR